MGAMYIKMISVLMEKIDMGKLNLMELDLLEKYLKEHGFMYKRIDEENSYDPLNRHQIIVYDNSEDEYVFDAVCHLGSYGYENGLLEILGSISRNTNNVEGNLTAKDVIERIEEKYNNSKEIEKSGIKQCPFCGASARVANMYDEYKITAPHDETCIFNYLYGWFGWDSKEEAVAAWNRRANDG